MKKYIFIFVGISFYCIFSAAHNTTLLLERTQNITHNLNRYEQVRREFFVQEFLANRLLHILWQRIDEQPAQTRRHTRRGDRYKKPIRAQYQQYNCNNNRTDRPKHAQFNKYIKQPHGKSI